LHSAVIDGDVPQVRKLLAAGEKPDATVDNGWTALHFAAQEWLVDVVRALIEAGASVDARDAHGNTPLWRAVFNSQRRGEIIQILRRAGADANAANSHGVSPVGLARSIANFDVQRFFSDLPAIKS
jgi:ankyrin repeat protein